MIALLKEYTKNSPVIVYNKIIESFDLFLKIVDNYKDHRSFIREATQELVEEFLKLLSNRDYKIREEYTSKIFAKIEKNFDSSDSNVIHGIILLLRACTCRREFFNEKYKKAIEFFNKHKNHKNLEIRILIIEHLPYFVNYLLQVFEANYFDIFMTNMIQMINNRPMQEMKSQIFIALGELSIICSREKFLNYVHLIVKIIKNEFDKNLNSMCLTIFDCMANLLKNYKSILHNQISYEEILVKMFKCGFYDSQCSYLQQLIESFEEFSIDRIKIIIVILNVISIIISDRKFYLKESYNHLKNLNLESDTGSLSFALPRNDTTMSFINLSSSDRDKTEQDELLKSRKYSTAMSIVGNKEFLNQSRKEILSYILNTKSNNRLDFNRITTVLIRNALNFLKQISHPFFAKDILSFYQQYCLKFLEQNTENLIKETAIDLATSPWIPRGEQNSKCFIKIDNDVEYIVNLILDSYMNVILNDSNDEIKLKMISNLDERYDRFLAKNNFFNKLTLILNFNDNSIREKTVQIIGRILHDNYTTIIIYIKKSILDIFSILDFGLKLSEKEDAVILLNYYVKYNGPYILDYVELIFSTLIKILKSNNNTNDVLNVSILSIVSELIANSKSKYSNTTTRDIPVREEYFKEIFSICIENLKDNSSNVKQEVSLKTILSILENSELEWNVYFDYPELVNILIQILIKETHKNSRIYSMRIFGFIGAMDPDKLEKLWSIHKIENNFIHENYEIDEYNNYDDEEIIAHKKKHMIISDKEFKKLTKINKKKMPDFPKMIIEQELDPCTYHAVRSLMNILKDNSQPEPSIQVIGILGSLLKSLQESDYPVVELILPTLLETIEDFETNYIKAIFDHILIILKNFKNNFKNYLKEVLDVLIKYIYEKDFQQLIFSILTKILEEFPEEMEIYFSQLIPLLLSFLEKNEKNIPNIQKYVFFCLSLMSDKLSNYLSIIIPEAINLISQTTLNSITTIELNVVRLSSKTKESFVFDEVRSKDEDLLFFINKIVKLSNLVQYLPKIVNALLKYLEANVNNTTTDKIMNLFLYMNEKLRDDFLIFLPTIIRTARNYGINLAPYFPEIKSSLDKDEVVEEIRNRNCEINRVSTIKRKRTESYNSNYVENRENMSKTRKSQIDKDLLVKEFDPVNCSIEEDWREWFKSTSKILFEQSPSYALYYCHNVADYYTPLLNELYNYAFVSCWRNLNDYHKMSIISYLNTALTSPKTPNEILLTILNLAEFIEREENHIDFIDFGRLGYVADVCKAFAKALYYKENDFRNNNDFNTLEQLIALYYELKLPEAAIGILKLAQMNNKIINEDDWYLKLHKWTEALSVFNKKLKIDQNNIDYLKGKFICLDGLCDWESLLNLGDELEGISNVEDPIVRKKSSINEDELITKMSPLIAKASFNLNEWDKLKYYIGCIQPDDEEEEYEKNFFEAVLAIKEENYSSAKVFIEKSRNFIDDKIKTLLSESYSRAYKLLLENDHLYELEEIILMRTDSSKKLTKEKLKLKWDKRFEIVDEDIKTYDRILAIRSLVFPLEEDYEKHLDLAKICRREDRFTNCLNVLNRLNRKLGQYQKNIKIKVELDRNKCLYENNLQDKAINNINQIINEEINFVDDILKSKIYCYYGLWNLQKHEKSLKEETVKSIMGYLELSTKYDMKNYKSWHNYALVNYKYFDSLFSLGKENKNSAALLEYACNGIKGFTHSVCIGGKNISKTLQDLLRLIDIWFIMGDKEEIDKLLNKSFEMIDLDSWLLVIPQLLARVNIVDERIRTSLCNLLRKIGNSHPRALLYPIIVMNKARSRKRRQAADSILEEMKKKHPTLTAECSLIIDELNRCALLLHEEWGEAIEESAKLYFQSTDIKGMIKILMDSMRR